MKIKKRRSKNSGKKKAAGRPIQKNEKRDGLLRTFVKLSYWKGAQAVTLQNLARETGVAFNTAHYHFGESGPAEAAADFVFENQRTFVESRMTRDFKKGFKNPLRSYFQTLFSWCDAHRDFGSFWLHCFYLASTHLRSQGAWARRFDEERVQIQKILLQSIGLGIYPPLRQLEALVTKIHGLMVAALFLRLIDLGKSTDEHFSLCWSSIETLIESHSQPRKSKKRYN